MRWHRFRNNIKEIRDFPVGFHPLSEIPNAPWIKGMGPFSPEALNNVRLANKQFLGVPKSPKQKEKMSKASKGIPKSDEHKRKLSKARKTYWEKIKSQ